MASVVRTFSGSTVNYTVTDQKGGTAGVTFSSGKGQRNNYTIIGGTITIDGLQQLIVTLTQAQNQTI